MLSRPHCGWITFKLDGTGAYDLGYLTDVPMDWLDAAIDGLWRLRPFCVAGSLEPMRMICVVSYWDCHIFAEHMDGFEMGSEEVRFEHSSTDMIDFCQMLHDDLSADIDAYARFLEFSKYDPEAKAKELRSKLELFQELIDSKTEYFGDNRFFW